MPGSGPGTGAINPPARPCVAPLGRPAPRLSDSGLLGYDFLVASGAGNSQSTGNRRSFWSVQVVMRPVMTFSCDCQDGRRRSGLTSSAARLARVIRLLVGLASLTLVISACGGGSTTKLTGSTLPSVSVPQGWKTYTYGKAAISVPISWEVKHDTNCPNTNAPGHYSSDTRKGGQSTAPRTPSGTMWP